MKKTLCILACSFSFMACTQTPAEISANTATLQAQLSAREALLLDVRTADEFNASHVPLAILMPYDSIAQNIHAIAPDKNQTIYLYCRSGRRSGMAVDTLKQLGYRNIVDLGGLNDLARYGLTVQPSAAKQ